MVVPFLSAGNWGGHGLHLRGNTEAFVRAASSQKWLELHGLEHWTHYYTDYGVGLQKRFFAHYLQGIDNGWQDLPPVILNARKADGFEQRSETEWPLASTLWTRLYLDPERLQLSGQSVPDEAVVSYDVHADGVTFMSSPFERETEITGPVAARLFVSSSTADADVFAVLRLFDPEGVEVVFNGAIDPHMPAAQGWLRASHRKLDPTLSTDHRPYHTHDEPQALEPGEVYQLDVEIWPTSIVVPVGHRVALTVRGKDYEYDGAEEAAHLTTFHNELRGCGPFIHDDPRDRPDHIFSGVNSLHCGGPHDAYLLLPVVPEAE